MELETPKNKAFEATTGNLVVGVRPFAKPLFGGSNPPAASSHHPFIINGLGAQEARRLTPPQAQMKGGGDKLATNRGLESPEQGSKGGKKGRKGKPAAVVKFPEHRIGRAAHERRSEAFGRIGERRDLPPVMNGEPTHLKACLIAPIPEIFEAAQYLDDAVTGHPAGDRATANELIRKADMPAIFAWTDSLLGPGGPFTKPLPVDAPSTVAKQDMVPKHIPVATERLLLARDGLHCRFCHIPLVPGSVRQKLQELYPEALRWGGGNPEKHSALQAMKINIDHVLPRSKGGSREPDNLVVACAPCNCGRSELTLEQAGLLDPRLREPIKANWDGLQRILAG